MNSFWKATKEKVFGKSVISITTLNEETREGINKAYIPKFLYKPPFGYPRFANMPYIRYLAQTPYVEMCLRTIIDEIAAIEWDILPAPGMEDFKDENEIQHIKNFFLNPNTNPNEGFEDVFIKMPVRDILELNTAVLNKVFNLKGEMVEVVARDAATFTVNPDIHGMFTYRDEIIHANNIVDKVEYQRQMQNSPNEVVNPFQYIPAFDARERAAYFQYGWIAGPVPTPFGKREIVWLQQMKRTDDHYGYSAIQILANSLQMLRYMVEGDLEYYNDNNVPKGMIGLEGASTDEIEAFKEQWFDIQRTKDEFGNWKKMLHKVPILNKIPKFERIQFTSQEMQFIEKQKFYAKMVWASIGVTGVELGYTDDTAGAANQIVQSKVFRKKAINPMLRLLESGYNRGIVSEFDYTKKIKVGKEIMDMPKYQFIFKKFDTDEETAKAELYKLWIETGIKTVNEVRLREGDKEVEWGDDPPKNFMAGGTNFNFPGQEGQNPGQNPKDPDKDFAKREANALKPDKPKEKTEDKAQAPENPLILKEGERPSDPERLVKAIMFILDANEKKLLTILKDEIPKSETKSEESIEERVKKLLTEFIGLIDESAKIEGKSLDTIINQLKAIFSFEGIKTILGEIMKNNYYEGHEQSEKEIGRNFLPDREALEYINSYTFENIKDMTEDIADDLRKELKMAFMNGEGIDKISERVGKVFDVSETRAIAIARTETNRAHSFGRLHAYTKNDIKSNKWLLWTDDDRTSPVTKALHKKYGEPEKAIPLHENFKVTVQMGKKMVSIDQIAPPFHIGERDGLMFTPVEDPEVFS